MQEVKINQLTLDQLIEVSREVHRQPLLSLARTSRGLRARVLVLPNLVLPNDLRKCCRCSVAFMFITASCGWTSLRKSLYASSSLCRVPAVLFGACVCNKYHSRYPA